MKSNSIFKVMLPLMVGGVLLTSGLETYAQDVTPVNASSDDSTALDELDPYDPNVEKLLEQYDRQYEQETGLPSHLPDFSDAVPEYGFMSSGCYRLSCEVYIQIVRSEQKAYLYVHGRLEGEWLVSTGTPGRGTPSFDKHPDGRIYDRYTSSKYPGGDYNGLGNMPYAVFIRGGFAIHGTGKSNWPRLGRRASHGCIRLHPDNAYRFNRLVRQSGISETWITVL